MTVAPVLGLLGLVSAAGALELARRVIERRLLYHPVRQVRATPADVGLPYEDVHLATPDGERLHGYWIPAAGRFALLYCHGNGGNVGDWVDKLAIFARAGVSVLLFDYRGYGRSTGTPSDRGLFADARAAYDHLVTVRGIRPQDLIVWGNSLGGAVAADLVETATCRGLVIESSPTSSREMAHHVLPWLPGVRLCARTDFDTLRHLRALTVPKLILHGDADPVVPFTMGRELAEAAAEPKRFRSIPAAGHSDGWLVGGRTYREEILAFLRAPTGDDEEKVARAMPEHAPSRN